VISRVPDNVSVRLRFVLGSIPAAVLNSAANAAAYCLVTIEGATMKVILQYLNAKLIG
jgi:hypothetical protein